MTICALLITVLLYSLKERVTESLVYGPQLLLQNLRKLKTKLSVHNIKRLVTIASVKT